MSKPIEEMLDVAAAKTLIAAIDADVERGFRVTKGELNAARMLGVAVTEIEARRASVLPAWHLVSHPADRVRRSSLLLDSGSEVAPRESCEIWIRPQDRSLRAEYMIGPVGMPDMRKCLAPSRREYCWRSLPTGVQE